MKGAQGEVLIDDDDEDVGTLRTKRFSSPELKWFGAGDDESIGEVALDGETLDDVTVDKPTVSILRDVLVLCISELVVGSHFDVATLWWPTFTLCSAIDVDLRGAAVPLTGRPSVEAAHSSVVIEMDTFTVSSVWLKPLTM